MMNKPDYIAKECSFCGLPENDESIDRMLEGNNGVVICNKCIQNSIHFINSEHSISTENIPKPSKIKAFLDKYVIGQEEAKRALSIAVYNHFKRILHKDIIDPDVELDKSNIMLVGGTGTGKTLLAKTLARILNVPFTIADATSMTEEGYVGDNVETMLQSLILNADGDIEKAQSGIIYIDEIEKKARKLGANVSISRDVSGEGVQSALLKLIEGTTVTVQPVGQRKHPHQNHLRINTVNILFILGGAFNGLSDIIAARLAKKNIGFLSEKNTTDSKIREAELLKQVTHKDLINFGIIPELAGRIPVLVTLNELNVNDLCKVLIEPKNSIVKQYIELMKMDNVELSFKKEALEIIAKEAIKSDTGARGLRTIVEKIMHNIMFEAPSSGSYIIDKSYVNKVLKIGEKYGKY